jgi:hypothetical protein
VIKARLGEVEQQSNPKVSGIGPNPRHPLDPL